MSLTYNDALETFWLHGLSLSNQLSSRIRWVSLICRLILSTHYERQDQIDRNGVLTDLDHHFSFVDTFIFI